MEKGRKGIWYASSMVTWGRRSKPRKVQQYKIVSCYMMRCQATKILAIQVAVLVDALQTPR